MWDHNHSFGYPGYLQQIDTGAASCPDIPALTLEDSFRLLCPTGVLDLYWNCWNSRGFPEANRASFSQSISLVRDYSGSRLLWTHLMPHHERVRSGSAFGTSPSVAFEKIGCISYSRHTAWNWSQRRSLKNILKKQDVAKCQSEKMSSFANAVNVCFVTFFVQNNRIKMLFFYVKSRTCSFIYS